mgnify:CR=1 FL=1
MKSLFDGQNGPLNAGYCWPHWPCCFSMMITVGNRVLETGLLSQPASFQCELRNSGPSQPVSKDWKLEKNCLTRSSRREVGSIHDMSGGLAACGVASAVLYPPSGVPPHHGTVQCRFVASCGDRGGIWNIMTSAHMVIGNFFLLYWGRWRAAMERGPHPALAMARPLRAQNPQGEPRVHHAHQTRLPDKLPSTDRCLVSRTSH